MTVTGMEKKNKRYIAWMIAGFSVCIIPPSLTAVHFFPLFVSSKSAAISVASVVVLALCCIPFYKQLKECLKSPSAWKMWTILFIILTALDSIVYPMKWVSLVGAVSGVVGAVCFRIAKKYKGEGEDSK